MINLRFIIRNTGIFHISNPFATYSLPPFVCSAMDGGPCKIEDFRFLRQAKPRQVLNIISPFPLRLVTSEKEVGSKINVESLSIKSQCMGAMNY